jgi:selenocysteine-specific translation elongation factor
MKSIIDINTGQLLYATSIEVELQNNQVEVDFVCTENFVKPFFNFQTNKFYEGASQDEMTKAQNENEIELKKQQHQQLLETDWYVTRFAETGNPIPADILELRNRIRNNFINK